MKTVVIESPYAGKTGDDLKRNQRYLRYCLEDSIERGEAPFASHFIYTRILDDENPSERKLGIRMGYAIGEMLDKVIVYTDLGISSGMRRAIEHYKKLGKEIEYRMIPGVTSKII